VSSPFHDSSRTFANSRSYKGRKFNARKEITDEKYYSKSIIRFYIKCTRCSAEITYKTDYKNVDYTCESGAQRNFEPWREAKLAEETEEERLDRLQAEEDNRDAMADLETKKLDAKTEMAVADALDEIRTKNAMREKTGKEGVTLPERDTRDEAKERQDREDEEAAKKAFEAAKEEHVEEAPPEPTPVAGSSNGTPAPPPSFKRTVKRKKDLGAALGIKKKKLV
jgi:hypothetical protein